MLLSTALDVLGLERFKSAVLVGASDPPHRVHPLWSFLDGFIVADHSNLVGVEVEPCGVPRVVLEIHEHVCRLDTDLREVIRIEVEKYDVDLVSRSRCDQAEFRVPSVEVDVDEECLITLENLDGDPQFFQFLTIARR